MKQSIPKLKDERHTCNGKKAAGTKWLECIRDRSLKRRYTKGMDIVNGEEMHRRSTGGVKIFSNARYGFK
jgi:hypothetical protein